MPRPNNKYVMNMPNENEITNITISLLRSELDNTEAARKISIPSRQRLNPASKPKKRTAIIDERDKLPKSGSLP